MMCFLGLILGSHLALSQMAVQEIIDRYENLQSSLTKNSSESWPKFSQERNDTQAEAYNEILDDFNAFELDSLEINDRINLEMLSYILRDKVYNLEYESHLMPLNSEGGFITSMVYYSQSRQLKTEEQALQYIHRLETTANYIHEQISLLNRGIEQNKVRPKLVVRNCIQILDGILANRDDDFFLLKPLESFPELIRDDLRHSLISSFEFLRSYLQDEYLGHAREELGIVLNKDGEAYYDQRIKYFTSLGLTAEEVYNIGLKEVDRIQTEMQSLLDGLNFEGDLNDFIHHLRTDSRFYAETPDELLYYAAWLSKKAEEFLPRYFTKLPRLPFTVNPVPEAIAPTYTAGRYSGGSMGDQRAGQYWVNTYKLESRPKFMLPALTLHEAVPGHHLQGSLAKEMKDLPSFRSYYLSAFGEGWGLYSEYLGKEAGFYETAYEDFGRLSYEMWRACRLVIDPGIHAFGWTREKAIEYMSSHTALSEHEINTEIDRYIGWPGQAVSYKIGEIKIRELRKRAEDELKESFDIREFHDLILSQGSVPLMTLEWMVENYIKDKLENE